MDFGTRVQKFCGSFNNILSVLGHNRKEICAVGLHLINSYCITSLLYGCENLDLCSSGYCKLNVIWNNALRKIFQCCWRESVSWCYIIVKNCHYLMLLICLQCFDTVGWASGRASGL